jgi:uncharacterized protein
VLTPCEIAVKTVSPAIRAYMAQTMMEKHDLSQIEVAKILGITQSAVSKYNKKVRGTTIPIEEIPQLQNLTDQMITLLMDEPLKQTEVMELFCQACTLIRSKGLMCTLCQQNQKTKDNTCNFCDLLDR